jgi:hypothetical protein
MAAPGTPLTSAQHKLRQWRIVLTVFGRRLLRQVLPAAKTQPWMKYAGRCQSGNPRSSASVDEVLYRERP